MNAALRSRGFLERGRLPRLDTASAYLSEGRSTGRDQVSQGRGSRSRSRAGSYQHTGSTHSLTSSASRTPNSSRSYCSSTSPTPSSSCGTRISVPSFRPQARRSSALSRNGQPKNNDGLCGSELTKISATSDRPQVVYDSDPEIDEHLSKQQDHDPVLHNGAAPAAPVHSAFKTDDTANLPFRELKPCINASSARPGINARQHRGQDDRARSNKLLDLVRHLETALRDLHRYLTDEAADDWHLGSSGIDYE